MHNSSPRSNSCLLNLGVVDSGCLPHLPFVAIGPLGPHDAEYTLELHLQLHWLVLDLLVKDGPGVEILAQLRFCIRLVALTAQRDHAVLRPILTRWLTRLL